MLSMNLKLAFVVALLFLTITPASAQEAATKTYTTADKTFSFEYPDTWFVEVPNPAPGPGTELSVDNLPLDQRFDSPDGLMLQISLPQKYYELTYGVAPGAKTPKDVLAAIVTLSESLAGNAGIIFGTAAPNETPQPLQLTPHPPDVKEFTVSGRPAAYSYNIHNEVGIDASSLMVIADLGNDYWVLVTASSFKGGLPTLQKFEATILTIVQSMRFTPPAAINSGNPALPQVFSGLDGIWERGYIQFDYPQDWYVSNPSTGIILISNVQGVVLNTAPNTGQFIAAVQGVSETRSAVDPAELTRQCDTGNSNWTARTLVAKLVSAMTPAQLDQLNKQGITLTQPEVTSVSGVEIVYLREYQ